MHQEHLQLLQDYCVLMYKERAELATQETLEQEAAEVLGAMETPVTMVSVAVAGMGASPCTNGEKVQPNSGTAIQATRAAEVMLAAAVPGTPEQQMRVHREMLVVLDRQEMPELQQQLWE
jgi:hypothetical protein